jgi:hypothetical protein
LVAAGAYYLGSRKTAPTITPEPVPTQTPTPIPTSDPTADWQICTNIADGFSIKYPDGYIINPQTCDYLPSYEEIEQESSDFKKNYVLTITSRQTSLSVEQWIKSKNICPDWGANSPSCSNQVKGVLPGSIQFDTLNRHYASIDTIVKHDNGIDIFDISLGARNPNEPISDIARNTYDQILSTFKFLEAAPEASPTSTPSGTITP